MCQLTGTLKQREKLWDRGLEKKVEQAMQIVNQYTTDTLLILHQQFTNTSLILSSPTCRMICQPIFDWYSTDSNMSLNRYNDRLSTDTWLTLERYSDGYVDSQSTEMSPDTLVDTPCKSWSTQSRICDLGQNRCKIYTPFSPSPKSRMGKWHVLAFPQLHPWFGGDGGLLFHFILSKIVV